MPYAADCPSINRSLSGICLALLVLLVACGSGSGTDSPPPPAPVTGCSGTFTPLTGTTAHNEVIPVLAKPSRGEPFRDPTYGACMVRVTDHVADGLAGFARNDYSRRQAFNADNSLQLVYALDGSWYTYNAQACTKVRNLSEGEGPAGDAEPQWHPTDPDLLYFLPTNGVGMRILQINVTTGAVSTVADLAARIRALWPSANAAWTKSEGSPSADGRYWGLMIDDADWEGLGLITYDLETDTVLGHYDFAAHGDARPDHVSMSPSGAYIVPSWDDGLGTTAFTRDFASSRQLHHKSEHSDLALDANGDDVYIAVDYEGNAGPMFMMNLRTGVKTELFDTYLSGTATAYHVSGKAYAEPGWVLISTYESGLPRQWLHKKILAVQLQADPVVVHLAHHQVTTYNGYWSEPHACVSRDFTRIAFSSNWNTASEMDIDAYQIRLPEGVLP